MDKPKITDHAFQPSYHYPEGQGCAKIIEGSGWTAMDPNRCRRPESEHERPRETNDPSQCD